MYADSDNEIPENDRRSYHSDEELDDEDEEVHNAQSNCRTCGGERRRRKTTAAIRRDVLLKQKRSESSTVRKEFLDECRRLFKKTLKVKNDADYAYYEGATAEEINSWVANQGPGPSEENLKLDMEGGVGSEWNAEVMHILMDKLRKYCLANKVLKKNPREDGYMRDLLEEKFKRIRKQWQAGQLKAGETANALEDRLRQKSDSKLKEARQNGRRSSKFLMRQRILRAKIETQTGRSRAMWQWASEVVETLGVGGMSSEESDTDSEDKAECTLKVKKMAWRRNIDKMLQEIDDCRIGAKATTGVFGKQGSKPMKRTRLAELVSRRQATAGLPEVLYDQEWLGKRKRWANENTVMGRLRWRDDWD
ncbi:hypothetical protein BDN71DRAFT_1510420 [Pleurotus eryngii]|uniref:Uncharacterized protein n=1 Tax=Pleurotus eryngii TaxID=5323 RepID=A0A9P5ZN92_PLEER|nr:hypothetical protein BDN71DRAFT_1510420 [Pleurotus eryngii]